MTFSGRIIRQFSTHTASIAPRDGGDVLAGLMVSPVLPFQSMPRVVLDTNVLVAAIRSRRGASFELISRLGTGGFEVAVSVSLVLEYEDALFRHLPASALDEHDVRDLVDYICKVAILQEIFFLWRPFLRDSGDDLVLELAVAAGCDVIVTHNVRDFAGAEKLGVRVLTPGKFLQGLRGNQWAR